MATPTTLPAAFVSGNVLTAAQLNDLRGAFRVLQVVSTTKDDVFTTASTSFTDITGLSLSITPSSSTSKILVISVTQGLQDSGVADGRIRLMRDSTAIFVGNAAEAAMGFWGGNAGNMIQAPALILDSPATTSAITYKMQCRNNSAGTFYVNRSKNDAVRGASTITAMEISA
jgi:hypothetical protein